MQIEYKTWGGAIAAAEATLVCIANQHFVAIKVTDQANAPRRGDYLYSRLNDWDDGVWRHCSTNDGPPNWLGSEYCYYILK